MTQAGVKNCHKMIAIDGNEYSALIDTGSNISLIRVDCYSIKIDAPTLINKQIKFRGVGSSENITLGETCVNKLILTIVLLK